MRRQQRRAPGTAAEYEAGGAIPHGLLLELPSQGGGARRGGPWWGSASARAGSALTDCFFRHRGVRAERASRWNPPPCKGRGSPFLAEARVLVGRGPRVQVQVRGRKGGRALFQRGRRGLSRLTGRARSAGPVQRGAAAATSERARLGGRGLVKKSEDETRNNCKRPLRGVAEAFSE